MEKLLVSFQIECTKQRLKIFQLSFVDWFESGKTPSTLLEATRDRAGDGEVVLVGIKTPAVEQSVPAPQTTTVPPKILPPVDTLLENEIWQYRYPPFDNIFNNPADDESSDSIDCFNSVRSVRSEATLSTNETPYGIPSISTTQISISGTARVSWTHHLTRSLAFRKSSWNRTTVGYGEACHLNNILKTHIASQMAIWRL